MPASNAIWHEIMTTELNTSITTCQDQLHHCQPHLSPRQQTVRGTPMCPLKVPPCCLADSLELQRTAALLAEKQSFTLVCALRRLCWPICSILFQIFCSSLFQAATVGNERCSNRRWGWSPGNYMTGSRQQWGPCSSDEGRAEG